MLSLRAATVSFKKMTTRLTSMLTSMLSGLLALVMMVSILAGCSSGPWPESSRAVAVPTIFDQAKAQEQLDWSQVWKQEQQTNYHEASPVQVSAHLVSTPSAIIAQLINLQLGASVDLSMLQGAVDVNWNQVEWGQALEKLSQGQASIHWKSAKHAQVVGIQELGQNNAESSQLVPSSGRTVTEIFRPRFQAATDLVKILPALLQSTSAVGGQNAKVFASGSRLVVQANPHMVKQAAGIISELDRPEQMFYLEAFVVESSVEFLQDIGLTLSQGNAAVGQVKSTWDWQSSLTHKNLSSMFGLLNVQGESQVLSNPKIYMMENQLTSIFQGDEIAYSTSNQDGTTTQFRNAGLQLDVLARRVGKQLVSMQVEFSKDSVASAATDPVISRRSLKTSMYIQPNIPTLIGGIHIDRESESTQGTPGERFRLINSQVKGSEKKQLYLILTVVLLGPGYDQ